MDSVHHLLQCTADLSLAGQHYLWSFLGIKPSEQYNNNNLDKFERAFTESQAAPPAVFIIGNKHIPMAALARRIAGLSGAVAIGMAAYSAHRVLMEPTIDERRKKAVENANKHHLVHTLGILFATKSRYPMITIACFASGILMFCGSCYAYGIWNNDKIRAISPLGGLMFILGWLSFVL